VDKDLLQIPGKMYNPVKKTFHWTTPEQGWHLFLTQWLTGDSTDGYPGLKGIGPKKAEKLITEADDPIRAIVDLYEERGMEWEFCRDQANFAMILTADRWDENKQEPLLWSPPHYVS
jgi:DNA polymerase-1